MEFYEWAGWEDGSVGRKSEQNDMVSKKLLSDEMVRSKGGEEAVSRIVSPE